MKSVLQRRGPLAVVGLVVLAAVSLAMLVLGQRGLLELYRLKRQSAVLEQGNLVLKDRNALVARQIQAVRNDPEIIENMARERLGMTKDGEVVYYLSDQAGKRAYTIRQAPQESVWSATGSASHGGAAQRSAE
ncbi:MAG: septum formation initiator family protein [Pseudomonadota bacterium]